MSSIRQRLQVVLNANALINRTVWSSPQRGEACSHCKYWVPIDPDVEYDPALQETYMQLTTGMCSDLRIMAAYKGVVPMRSYYYCSFFEEKEKDNGKDNHRE